MFNLIKYRYLFLLISLIIIIPGTISLIVTRLNVGIDFVGGSNVELRPQHYVASTQIKTLLSPLKLADLQIVTGDTGNNPGLAANKTIWVTLNTQIDKNVQDTITSLVQNKYGPGTNVNFTDIPSASAKTFTLVTIIGFQAAPQTSDIQTLLTKLPNTSDPNKGAPTASATVTTGTTTPTASTTPTVTGKVTPTTSATTTVGNGILVATPTTSTTANPANILVSATKVLQGTTTETINIQTATTLKASDLPRLYATILNSSGPYMQAISNSEVGPSVASETTRNAVLAVIAASVFILLYIWFAFRKVNRPWRYGTCAIIALLHDVLVVLGIFSILGWAFHVQVDALFITALLTVVGFSVHDTIVVFDRIRENMQHRTSESFDEVVNASLVQTMARSLNTSLTVIFTLTALTLFVGTGSVHNFTLALLVGIVSGTYSSIFNASMLLVMWEKGELGTRRFQHEHTADGRKVRELVRSRG